MALSDPYADDASLLEACLRDERDAWAALRARYGASLYATVVGALEGPRAADLDVEGTLELVWDELAADGALHLRRWSGESQLRTYLTIVARHLALAHSEASTSPAVLVASQPTPSALFLDDLLAAEPATRVAETLEKLPPNIGVLVRLRLRGLSRDDIAATLGTSPATVRANLERVARRLGDLDAADTGATWRVLLDAAEIEERVAHALRVEDDGDYRGLCAIVEKTWRAVGERALGRPAPRGEGCLDDPTLAGSVDGTLRGPGRARAEGHLASCPRCVDEAAALVVDLRVAPTLRDAGELDPAVAVAAACLAMRRFASGERLATRAIARGVDGLVAGQLRRLAQAGRLLAGAGSRRAEQTSQVVATHLAAGAEAPLIAFEALASGDPHAAWRAIDDLVAKQTLGARLRLLAAAAGRDAELGHSLAEATLGQPSVDPGHTCDARAVMALPRGRALPRDVLVARLEALVPAAVRFVLTRSSPH